MYYVYILHIKFFLLDHFQDISEMANYLNEPEIMSTFKKLTRDPGILFIFNSSLYFNIIKIIVCIKLPIFLCCIVIGELVIAPFSRDGFYYRAKVIQPGEYGYVKVSL